MKLKLPLVVLACLFIECSVFAQSPQLMNYQAVVRNTQGQPVQSTLVNFQFKIHDGSAGGNVEFTETDTATTNPFGLATVQIGSSGTLSAVNWGSSTKFMQVLVDVTGGTNFVDMGTTQLLSVPYALFAAHATATDSSNWSTSGSNIYNNNSGNVGIGTNNPLKQLHVKGNSTAPGSLFEIRDTVTSVSSLGGINIANTDPTLNNYSLISFADSAFATGPASVKIGAELTDRFNHIGDFVVAVRNPGTGLSEAMRVKSPGNVGIGTSTPSVKLDVENGTLSPAFKLGDGTQGVNKVLTSDSAGDATWQPVSVTSLLGSAPVPAADFSCLGTVADVGLHIVATRLAVSGSYVYVTGPGTDSLAVINFTNPNTPVVAGKVVTDPGPYGVAALGNYVYVINHSANSMQVFNAANPALPVPVGTVSTGNMPHAIAVAGNHAYVGCDDNTFQVIDISNPVAPAVVGRLTRNKPVRTLAVSGNYAYVSDSTSDSLQIINISNPALPVIAGTVNTPLNISGIAVSGSYAYLACQRPDSVFIYNVSNPAAPVRTGGAQGIGNLLAIAVSGNYAYFSGLNGSLWVFDISNPAAPVAIRTLNIPGNNGAIAVSGNYAWVASGIANGAVEINLTCATGVTINPDGGFTTQTNLLSGEGTAGYLPVFGHAGNLVNSQVYTTSVGVGIGSVPFNMLDVAGGVAIGSYAGQQQGAANGLIVSGSVGIGTYNPAAALDIESGSSPAFKLTDGTQATGNVLTSDANGNAAWQPPAVAAYGFVYVGGTTVSPSGLYGVAGIVRTGTGTYTITTTTNFTGPVIFTANFWDTNTFGFISYYPSSSNTITVSIRNSSGTLTDNDGWSFAIFGH